MKSTFLLITILLCTTLWSNTTIAPDSSRIEQDDSQTSYYTLPPISNLQTCISPNHPVDTITYQLFNLKDGSFIERKKITRYQNDLNHQDFNQALCLNKTINEASLLIIQQHSQHKFSNLIHLKEKLEMETQDYYLLQAIISHLGFTLGIAFLQIFFFFYTHRKEHLLYTFFILSFAHTTLTFSGLDSVILPSGIPWSKYILSIHYIGSAFLIWASMHLLEMWKKKGLTYYFMLTLLLSSLSYGVLSLIVDYPPQYRLSVESFGLLTLILFSSGLRASFKRVNQAQLYTLAWAVYLVGLLVFILNHNQIINIKDELSVEILLLCHSFEMLIFTLALSLKVYNQIQIKIKKIRELDKIKNKAITFPKQKLMEHLDTIQSIETEYKLNSTTDSLTTSTSSPVEKLQSALNNLKVCSDIFEQKYESKKEPFFLSEIVEECRVEEGIPRNRFNFIDECSSTSFLSVTDIKIVIKELLKNANTHSPQGLIEIQCNNQHKGFSLSVHNQGAGFSKEALKSHPSLFFKKEYKVRENTQGLGIGLFLCSELARYYGGGCKLENISTGALVKWEIPVV